MRFKTHLKSKTSHRIVILATLVVVLSGCCFLHSFWSQGTRPLTYFIHTGVPNGWVSPITSASSTWNGVYNLFTYGGRGGGGAYADDGVNSVFMTFFSDNRILAAVLPHGGCLLHDTDMGWNANRSDFTTSGSGGVDVQTVALHEFGHYGILEHVICPGSSIMLPSYQGVRRSPSGCDAFGMFVSNVLPTCYPAMGICFPSFFSFGAFDSLDGEDQQTLEPFEAHTDELIQIWNGNSALRSSADSVGDFYANLALDFENGYSTPWSYYFTLSRYNEIDSQIISPVYASASSALRADLNNLRSHLQSKIGLSFGQIFSGDLEEYPNNPGEPIESDPEPTCYSCDGPSTEIEEEISVE